MAPSMRASPTPSSPRRFWAFVAAGLAVVLAGLAAAHFMEEHGHIVTGMNNQVVWGMPHVFAIFLIVAASGVLNVASIGSVFRQAAYKPRARFSALLCLALLAGGLAVLMLDLGRPERVIVAMTHYNFTSVFAWNMFLYSGMAAIVVVYLWTLMERRMGVWSPYAGTAAFAWRIILTSGTGSIFAFLVARQAYGAAILVPLFLAMSFAWGLAVFLVAESLLYRWHGIEVPVAIRRRMQNLLALFVIAVLFFVLIHHLTNIYFAKAIPFERFILKDGGVYPQLFWWGYVVAGSVAPLILIWRGAATATRGTLAAPLLVVAGAFSLLYVFIIGGQAYPLELFPGFETTSSFGDGQVRSYAPSLPEVALGFGGLGIAFLIAHIGAHVFDFLPRDEASPAPGAG